MTYWLIAAALVVVGFALVWWSSGRRTPTDPRRDISAAMEIRFGREQDRSTRFGPFLK